MKEKHENAVYRFGSVGQVRTFRLVPNSTSGENSLKTLLNG